ncbi:MAG: preprotein translocase subunit SecA, partial [Actinotalea sp.]|nr:preprotein translocase subunit SecA [Actinotalea sp.]
AARPAGGRPAAARPAAVGAAAVAAVTAATKEAAEKKAAARAGTPRLIAKGLDGPERQVPLQYTAPSVDGDAKVVTTLAGPLTSVSGSAVSAQNDGQTFPGTPRNSQCPCGSGKKYKVCHGKNDVV